MKRLSFIVFWLGCLACQTLLAQETAKSAAKSPPSATKSDSPAAGAAKSTPSAGTETKPAAPAPAKPKAPALPKLDTAEEYINRGESLRAIALRDPDTSIKKYQPAKNDFDQALKLDPKSVTALLGRARVLSDLKREDDGIADCAAALKIDPKSTEALLTRSRIYGKKHRYDEQIADLSEIIRLEPDDAANYNRRSTRLRRQNRPSACRRRLFGGLPPRSPQCLVFFQSRDRAQHSRPMGPRQGRLRRNDPPRAQQPGALRRPCRRFRVKGRQGYRRSGKEKGLRQRDRRLFGSRPAKSR